MFPDQGYSLSSGAIGWPRDQGGPAEAVSSAHDI